ncbi:MAG: PorP/SprF family type IX secretion system membrane protein [Bacteroidaceae bacterium]|nr:PorP/SprF family type IX secretion system membrane protein [Bacteroidaceae bacterium]
MRKWLLIALLSACAVLNVSAQYDAHFTHYWKMQNFYNPAGAGFDRQMTIYAAYSNQLTGFEGNPKTMLINIDTPIPFIKSDHNLGLGVVNDEIGKFSNQHLYLNYAYGFKLFKGRFVIGAQIGLVNSSFENKDLDFGGENNDPAFPSGNADGNNFDVGAGLLYQHKYFYVGASGLHLNAPLIEMGEKNEIRIDPYLNFMAGGNIPLKNPLFSIQPSLQVMTDFVAWRADITGKATYSYNGKEFFGGVTYSPTTSVALFLGVEMMNITLSYGYELFTSGVGAAYGNHDIYLGYKIDLGTFKKGKNKHNSIRILQ